MARLMVRRRSSCRRGRVRSGCAVQLWEPTSTRLCQIARAGLLLIFVIASCLLNSLTLPLFAQTDVNDVHVPAREVAKSAPADEVPKQNLLSPGLSARVRPLKVDVDLVLVPVTITDPMNRLVTGLEKDNFQLFEGSAAQEIKSFSSEDAPVSLGVIFDSSGSMSSKMERAKEAVSEFFKTATRRTSFS